MSFARFIRCKKLEIVAWLKSVLVTPVLTLNRLTSPWASWNRIFWSSHQPTGLPAILIFLIRWLSKSHNTYSPKFDDRSSYPSRNPGDGTKLIPDPAGTEIAPIRTAELFL